MTPRLKPSTGKLVISTAFPDEFQRFLCYELENARIWNPETIKGGLTGSGWAFQSVHPEQQWSITYSPNDHAGRVVIVSDLPRFRIRKGLTINMGQERIEIE